MTSQRTAQALRDHAQQVLEAVVKDLPAPQTLEAQSAKSIKDSSPASGHCNCLFRFLSR